MTDHTATSAERFTSILLQDVMDHMDLPDILRAMGVNRFWRDRAINHRTYYGELRILENDPPGCSDLFLLRISRSAARPIAVFIEHNDPRLINAIAEHLAHIRALTVQFVHFGPEDLTAPVLEPLRRPAPMLRRLSINFMVIPRPPAATLPPNFLAGYAPELERVFLNGVAFSYIPECFTNLGCLSVSYSSIANKAIVLPNPFERCRNLQALFLRDRVTLDPQAFCDPHAWDSISQFEMSGFTVAMQWPDLRMLLSRVTTVTLRRGNMESALELVDTLPGALEVIFQSQHRQHSMGGFWPPFFTATLRCIPDARAVRKIEDHLTESGSISLFSVPSCTDRIVQLTLPIVSWNEYVGMSVFGPFNALETLVLTVRTCDDFDNPAPSKLSCPRLRQLVLRREQHEGGHLIVDLSAVVNFARASVPDVTFPLRLRLDGIVLNGAWNDFPGVFSSSDASNTRS